MLFEVQKAKLDAPLRVNGSKVPKISEVKD